MMNRFVSVWCAGAIVLLAAADPARAQAALVIVEPTINGDAVTLPVHIQGDVVEAIAALDFDLTYDPAVLQPVGVVQGAAAAEAGKNVQARMVEDGRFVVLMLGPSDGAVAQGEVVRISMTKIGDPESGETPVAITDTTFATIAGNEVPSQGSSATLLFEAPPDGDSGNAGGLPPIGGGGSIPADETGDPSSDPQPNAPETNGDPKVTGQNPQPNQNLVSLNNARAEAAERLAMLENVQAQRLAARTALENELTSAAATAPPRSSVPTRNNPPRAHNAAEPEPNGRPDERDALTKSVSPPAAPVVKPAQMGTRADSAPVETVPTPPGEASNEGASGIDTPPVTPAEQSSPRRALLLAGCVVLVLGAYGFARRRTA